MTEKTTVSVDNEQLRVLNAFNHIREHDHGEMVIAVKDGHCVKLWTTDKWDGGTSPGKLRETPEPRS